MAHPAARNPCGRPALALRARISRQGRMLPVAKAGSWRNHPQKGMTHPDGSNRIWNKPQAGPAKGSGDPGTDRFWHGEANLTSATASASTRTGGQRGEGPGYGIVLFPVVLLLMVGFFNMIYGSAAIAN